MKKLFFLLAWVVALYSCTHQFKRNDLNAAFQTEAAQYLEAWYPVGGLSGTTSDEQFKREICKSGKLEFSVYLLHPEFPKGLTKTQVAALEKDYLASAKIYVSQMFTETIPNQLGYFIGYGINGRPEPNLMEHDNRFGKYWGKRGSFVLAHKIPPSGSLVDTYKSMAVWGKHKDSFLRHSNHQRWLDSASKAPYGHLKGFDMILDSKIWLVPSVYYIASLESPAGTIAFTGGERSLGTYNHGHILRPKLLAQQSDGTRVQMYFNQEMGLRTRLPRDFVLDFTKDNYSKVMTGCRFPSYQYGCNLEYVSAEKQAQDLKCRKFVWDNYLSRHTAATEVKSDRSGGQSELKVKLDMKGACNSMRPVSEYLNN